MTDYVHFGAVPSEEDARAAPSESVTSLRAACASNHAFTIVDTRVWESPDTGTCDILVVDCVNDQVPTRNAALVMVRERLALVLPRDPSKAPQVRALRTSFPPLMHLNNVPPGEPASLCLYFEPWPNARRTWTAERFLQRILFWLTGSSNGTLHRPGQPVEAMYFESPIDVVLPPEWSEQLGDQGKVLVLVPVQPDDKRCTLRGLIAPRIEAARREVPSTVAIRVAVGPVVHGGVEVFPATLGELSDRLVARGSSLLEPLQAEVVALVGSSGVATVPSQTCLLLLSIPMKRSADSEVERMDVRGYHLSCDLKSLGVDLGALSEVATAGRHYPVTIIGGSGVGIPGAMSWRQLRTGPITVRESVTKHFARLASGIAKEGADDKRILAGVGALGSSLADLWSRESWGQWTLVDPDVVQPHNIVRHIARDCHIGRYKVDVVKDTLSSSYPFEATAAIPIRGDILTTTNPQIVEDSGKATLIVDATTTLEVPRELSRREDLPRCVSVFLTPSGQASVMLLEEAQRHVRLDELEAQYYGAILSSAWGGDHLSGHNGELWVGAGCRDISLILSNELVQLHASLLARQVRLLSAADSAQIRIWCADEQTSEVRAVDVPVRAPIRQVCGPWTVVSHDGVSEKLNRLRAARLPRETGGVVVGYVDHPLKSVFVVDILPAPADSEESEAGFVRGVDGLVDALHVVRDRTAGIVGYIGEWHSHPPFNRPNPSGDDARLLAHCARTLALEGVPALMVIVGAGGEISYSVGGPSVTMAAPASV